MLWTKREKTVVLTSRGFRRWVMGRRNFRGQLRHCDPPRTHQPLHASTCEVVHVAAKVFFEVTLQERSAGLGVELHVIDSKTGQRVPFACTYVYPKHHLVQTMQTNDSQLYVQSYLWNLHIRRIFSWFHAVLRDTINNSVGIPCHSFTETKIAFKMLVSDIWLRDSSVSRLGMRLRVQISLNQYFETIILKLRMIRV